MKLELDLFDIFLLLLRFPLLKWSTAQQHNEYIMMGKEQHGSLRIYDYMISFSVAFTIHFELIVGEIKKNHADIASPFDISIDIYLILIEPIYRNQFRMINHTSYHNVFNYVYLKLMEIKFE